MKTLLKVLLITLIVCFSITEIYLRYVSIYVRPQIAFPFNREINSLPLLRPFENKLTKLDYAKIDKKLSEDKSAYWIFVTMKDKDICTKNVPSTTARLFYKVSGEIIFNCYPNHDEIGRRLTTDHPKNPVDNYTLFLGGSRTYGWGVEDNETVPSLYQQLNQNTFVYNYAIPSNGIQMFIRQFELQNIAENVSQKKGNILYILDHNHLRRFIPSSDHIWSLHGPHYILNSENKMEYAGSYWETDFFKSTLYYFFSLSAFFQRIGFHLPLKLDENDYLMTAKALAKLKEVTEKQFPESIFKIITFSSDPEIEKVNFFLKKELLNILTIKMDEFGEWGSPEFYKYHFKYDLHPNAKATPIMARKLYESLNK